MENKVSINIAPADLAAVKEAVAVIQAKLGPNLISLSANDRKSLNKMGQLSRGFVEKFIEYVGSNPEFLPPFQDVEELKKDWKAISELIPIFNALSQISSNLDDTIMEAGAELMEPANLYYGTVGLGAKAGLPNAKPIHADLATRYVKKKKKKDQ